MPAMELDFHQSAQKKKKTQTEANGIRDNKYSDLRLNGVSSFPEVTLIDADRD